MDCEVITSFLVLTVHEEPSCGRVFIVHGGVRAVTAEQAASKIQLAMRDSGKEFAVSLFSHFVGCRCYSCTLLLRFA